MLMVSTYLLCIFSHTIFSRVGPDLVNMENAVNVGRIEISAYEESWPDGFNRPLSNNVVTMAVNKKVYS